MATTIISSLPFYELFKIINLYARKNIFSCKQSTIFMLATSSSHSIFKPLNMIEMTSFTHHQLAKCSSHELRQLIWRNQAITFSIDDYRTLLIAFNYPFYESFSLLTELLPRQITGDKVHRHRLTNHITIACIFTIMRTVFCSIQQRWIWQIDLIQCLSTLYAIHLKLPKIRRFSQLSIIKTAKLWFTCMSKVSDWKSSWMIWDESDSLQCNIKYEH